MTIRHAGTGAAAAPPLPLFVSSMGGEKTAVSTARLRNLSGPWPCCSGSPFPRRTCCPSLPERGISPRKAFSAAWPRPLVLQNCSPCSCCRPADDDTEASSSAMASLTSRSRAAPSTWVKHQGHSNQPREKGSRNQYRTDRPKRID